MYKQYKHKRVHTLDIADRVGDDKDNSLPVYEQSTRVIAAKLRAANKEIKQ